LKAVSGKSFARLLEKRGWELARVNGSHYIYIKTGRLERISIPVHKNKSLKIGLQRSLMRIADIGEQEL